MTILATAQQLIELKKKTAKEYAGPCPECGGSDRFIVWPDRDAFYCRGCQAAGDELSFLRRFAGYTCPDAHEALGRSCSATSCPAWDKCRLGARANGGAPRQKREAQSLQLPESAPDRLFEPSTADNPQARWVDQATQLVAKAHAALIDTPDQLAYLAGRGLDREAVEHFQLGFIAENRYPSRSAWGLPEEKRDDGKPKKGFIPAGILIPFFDIAGQPHRLRIRRSDPRPDDPRYYWVPGSGNDVPIIGHDSARAVVIIESDLDALMVLWQCRDLDLCTLPLGTVSAKPKTSAMPTLNQAASILVALDFEPRTNATTGKNENPGGDAAKWWLQQFPRAERWPVPAGKDPGEYYQQQGDIRAWVLAGLPPLFSVAEMPQKKPNQPEKVAPSAAPVEIHGTTAGGYKYIIAATVTDVARLEQENPELAVFSPAEIAELQRIKKEKGMTKEQMEGFVIAKFSKRLFAERDPEIDQQIQEETK